MEPSIKDLQSLEGRVAIITGGAGLLGRQHAAALAELGANTILWDLNQESLVDAERELGERFPEKISFQVVDISSKDSVLAAVREVEDRFGSVHVLVNNAGMTVAKGQKEFEKYFDSFEDYPYDLWKMAIDVNLGGTFLVTQAVAPLLLKNGGEASVINIASDVGVISPDHRIYQPNPERNYEGATFNTPLSYATSKAALIHMTRYWATYWAKKGVRVNSISPAGVENGQDPKFVRELVDRIPLGRMAKRFEYKGAIAFLASDASSFMTGANLCIDGGRTAW